MNACFDFLDRAVIDGRADEIAIKEPEMTFARLLEDVAAVAGVLRAVGVVPASTVGITATDDLHAAIAALAALRLGAAPKTSTEPVTVTDRDGATHLVWGDDLTLDWTGILKAGRTDPAAAYENLGNGPDLRALATPLTLGELRALVVGQ